MGRFRVKLSARKHKGPGKSFNSEAEEYARAMEEYKAALEKYNNEAQAIVEDLEQKGQQSEYYERFLGSRNWDSLPGEDDEGGWEMFWAAYESDVPPPEEPEMPASVREQKRSEDKTHFLKDDGKAISSGDRVKIKRSLQWETPGQILPTALRAAGYSLSTAWQKAMTPPGNWGIGDKDDSEYNPAIYAAIDREVKRVEGLLQNRKGTCANQEGWSSAFNRAGKAYIKLDQPVEFNIPKLGDEGGKKVVLDAIEIPVEHLVRLGPRQEHEWETDRFYDDDKPEPEWKKDPNAHMRLDSAVEGCKCPYCHVRRLGEGEGNG